MTIEVDITARAGYVVVAYAGELRWRDSEQLVEGWKRAIATEWTDPSQTFRLLIDLRRVRGPISLTGGFRKALETWGGSRRMRMAWLYGDPRNEAWFKYREVVARHLGFSARSFRDPKRAVHWVTGRADTTKHVGRYLLR